MVRRKKVVWEANEKGNGRVHLAWKRLVAALKRPGRSAAQVQREVGSAGGKKSLKVPLHGSRARKHGTGAKSSKRRQKMSSLQLPL